MKTKKLVALVLVVVLAITSIVGTTLAYFKDTDEAKNTFTFGNVKIEQNEYQRTENGDQLENGLYKFEQNQVIFPAVLSKLDKKPITVDGYTFEIRELAGNYQDKIVNVKNTGNMDAYVRVIIAIPSMNGNDNDKDATFNPFHWNYLDAADNSKAKGTGWDWNGSNDAVVDQEAYLTDMVLNGKEYDVFVATYNKAVPAGGFTMPAMAGFYLHNTVGYEDIDTDDVEGEVYFYVNKAGKKVSLSKWLTPDEDGMVTADILVATQACQTEGFTDAWEALDAAFGAITATNNPWGTFTPVA